LLRYGTLDTRCIDWDRTSVFARDFLTLDMHRHASSRYRGCGHRNESELWTDPVLHKNHVRRVESPMNPEFQITALVPSHCLPVIPGCSSHPSVSSSYLSCLLSLESSQMISMIRDMRYCATIAKFVHPPETYV
jgi:hypothetical protein